MYKKSNKIEKENKDIKNKKHNNIDNNHIKKHKKHRSSLKKNNKMEKQEVETIKDIDEEIPDIKFLIKKHKEIFDKVQSLTSAMQNLITININNEKKVDKLYDDVKQMDAKLLALEKSYKADIQLHNYNVNAKQDLHDYLYSVRHDDSVEEPLTKKIIDQKMDEYILSASKGNIIDDD